MGQEKSLGEALQSIGANAAKLRENSNTLRAQILGIEGRLATVPFDYWHEGAPPETPSGFFQLGFVEMDGERRFVIRRVERPKAVPGATWTTAQDASLAILADAPAHVATPVATVIPAAVGAIERVLTKVRELGDGEPLKALVVEPAKPAAKKAPRRKKVGDDLEDELASLS